MGNQLSAINKCQSLKSGDIYRVQEALPLGYCLEISNLLSKFQQACLIF